MKTIVIIVMVVLTLVGIGYWLWKQWRQRKAEASVLEWVKRVEKATTDAEIVRSYKPYVSTFDGDKHLADTARESAAVARYEQAVVRVKTAEFVQAVRAGGEPSDIASLCLAVFAFTPKLDTMPIFGIPAEELGQLFSDAMTKTETRARQGYPLALHGYTNVMGKPNLHKFCEAHGITPPVYPADWDDIVVEFVETPSVSDFKNTPDQSIGQVQMKAAMALRTHDLKMAKLVLAYCLVEREEYGNSVSGYSYSYGYVSGGHSKQVIWPFRDAIGDVLLADLINMVEAGTHVTSSYREALEA